MDFGRDRPQYHYLLNWDEEGVYLNNNYGLIATLDEVEEICDWLMEYAICHEMDIVSNNKWAEEHKYNLPICNESTQKQCERKHVYLFECAGRYKIGVSKNVPRRMKQLDNRPFPLRIVAQSQLVDEPFDIEHRLHVLFRKQNINGEWFDIDEEQADALAAYIKKLGTDDSG